MTFLNYKKNIFVQIRVTKELIKMARKKHLEHKESLMNVETKKTSTGGLKTKLQARKSRRSMVSPRHTEEKDMGSGDVMK